MRAAGTVPTLSTPVALHLPGDRRSVQRGKCWLRPLAPLPDIRVERLPGLQAGGKGKEEAAGKPHASPKHTRCTRAPLCSPEKLWQGAGGGMTAGVSASSPSAVTMGRASASIAAHAWRKGDGLGATGAAVAARAASMQGPMRGNFGSGRANESSPAHPRAAGRCRRRDRCGFAGTPSAERLSRLHIAIDTLGIQQQGLHSQQAASPRGRNTAGHMPASVASTTSASRLPRRSPSVIAASRLVAQRAQARSAKQQGKR